MPYYTRRDFMKMTAAAATTSVSAAYPAAADPNRRKPNVIIMLIDDLGHGDIGCFGNTQIPTPHIDALAQRGARLTMSYITNPPCSPSRYSLLTGAYAQRFGKFGMARGLPLPKDHPTLAELMRDAGYVTGQIGKWDMGSRNQGPSQRGFTEVARWAPALGESAYACEKPDGSTINRTEQDSQYLVEFVERNHDKPFFLYFSPLAIHTPLDNVPVEYQNRVEGTPEFKTYAGAVISVDEVVGKLVATLKKHGIENDTLILFTGDNGPEPTGSAAPYTGGKYGGNTQKEGWVHTPAIACWPGTIPGGQDFAGLTCTLDYYATAAAVAGAPLPDRCDGLNILPYLTGKQKGDIHAYLYWYNADPNDGKTRHLSAVRWKNWRLLLDKKAKEWRLFDIVNDPRESTDLAAEQPEVLEQLKQKHAEFVAALPSLDSIPAREDVWVKAPTGWGWIMSDGKMDPFPPGDDAGPQHTRG